ncbi:MAG: tetratricopeptide repeat protein [Chloroflexota bacterium]|nr:tetratricopeptide repeat protein [Chloroflexota bacterium]MDQ5867233.1 tetratricopeptide repeat protein [Chloroflexota bacterium]
MLSEDPESLDALYNQGNVYMDHGKYELAAEQFRKVLATAPEHHAAFYKLGYALEYLGRLDEAIEAYDQAVKTAPDPELTRPPEVLNFVAEAREGIDRLRKLKEYLAKTSFYDSQVNRAIWHVREVMRESTPPIVDQIFFGAMDIDPRNLFVAFAYADSKALGEARQKGHFDLIRKEFLSALLEAGYPPDALPMDKIEFVSKKEVDEQGGPWIYFR